MQGELIRAAMQKDEPACRELFGQWFGRAYRAAKAVCGSRSLAEDAVQEALLRFWRVFPRLRDPEAAERYFMRVVVNEARRLRSRRRAARETPLAEEGLPAAFHPNAEEETERAELLAKAVKSLPETLRAAVEIRYYGGFTDRETAELLGISPASAKMRLSRGRRKLREFLEQEGFDVIGG